MTNDRKSSVNHIIRVYDDSEGTFIEIGPDGDGLGGIEVRTVDKNSREFFGEFRIVLSTKDFATKLAQAILELADYMT